MNVDVTLSKLLTSRVGKQWLALPVEQLSEVVAPQQRTRMPLAPEAVNGLINLRGRILTELDMRKILRLPPLEGEQGYRTIIVETDSGNMFGLTVDAVGEVVAMEPESFEHTPDSLDDCWKQVCRGVLKQKDRVLVLIDVEKVLAMSMPETE